MRERPRVLGLRLLAVALGVHSALWVMSVKAPGWPWWARFVLVPTMAVTAYLAATFVWRHADSKVSR